MGEDNIDVIINIVLIVLAFTAAGFIFGWGNLGDTRELGQSICEEEYDMDFKSYDDRELKCKPKAAVEQEQYDGIIIKIMEE